MSRDFISRGPLSHGSTAYRYLSRRGRPLEYEPTAATKGGSCRASGSRVVRERIAAREKGDPHGGDGTSGAATYVAGEAHEAGHAGSGCRYAGGGPGRVRAGGC